MTADKGSFDWAIGPVQREEFFAEYFEKKHLVVKRGQLDYYGDLLTMADVDRAISTMGLEVPEITVTRADANIAPTDYSYESGFIDSVRLNQLFADGATVILNSLQERMPNLANFCRALELAFSCRIQNNIYLTPGNSQGFRAHYDSHDVLVLQLSGTKEWRIYDQPVDLPLKSQEFDPDAVPVGAETDRFVLEPGDLAYVPRGLIHDAVATDEPSLHITTGLMTRTWIEVMHEALAVLGVSDAAFRASLPPGHANPGFDQGPAKAKFEDLLKRVAEQAEFEPLFKMFKSDFIAGRLPRAHGQMAEIARLDRLSPDSQVGARPNLIFEVTAERGEGDAGPSVVVMCQGAEIKLPLHARDALEYALQTPRFRLGDMPGGLDDAGKMVLVRRLVREGLMVSHT